MLFTSQMRKRLLTARYRNAGHDGVDAEDDIDVGNMDKDCETKEDEEDDLAYF